MALLPPCASGSGSSWCVSVERVLTVAAGARTGTYRILVRLIRYFWVPSDLSEEMQHVRWVSCLGSQDFGGRMRAATCGTPVQQRWQLQRSCTMGQLVDVCMDV